MDAFSLIPVVVILLVFLIIKSRLITKLLDLIVVSDFYKKYISRLVKHETDYEQNTTSPLYPLKKEIFEQIETKLHEVPGDVLEIGAGSGSSLDCLRLPEGSSLVVMDYNHHFEKLFRENLSKYPNIKLKEYLVQSAVDMSNIPDNSFSIVYVKDVLCSIEENSLRCMLKEIKRVLKPNGCFYFLEHVLDKPGTWRRTFQKLICWINIWPRLCDNCHCDKETWNFIQETGFSSVSLSYTYIAYHTTGNLLDKIQGCMMYYFIKYFLTGHARK